MAASLFAANNDVDVNTKSNLLLARDKADQDELEELMSLKCEFEEESEVASYVFTFNKNEIGTADVYKYIDGKLKDTIEEATLIWSPSSITIKYSVETSLPSVRLYSTATISRQTLTYRDKSELGGNGRRIYPSYRTGKCNIVEVVNNKPKKIF